MNPVAASIPGRMRLRVASSDQPELARRLLALDVSCRAEAHPKSDSLLLFYDPCRLPQAAAEAAARHLLAADAPEQSAAPRRKRHYTQASLTLNRYAKYGMLAGLGASLYCAAVGAMRAHAWTGAIFVACLGAHLAVHRHRLVA
ncbi:MAG: hypothetical protein LBD68_11115 [Zoogloeaceae bacterium]|jgi:hypothetical protein|nr:hypothetical protein [Zoogloeaceae bacterium]